MQARCSTFICFLALSLTDGKKSLTSLGVRSNLIGTAVNLIRERAEDVDVRASAETSPDPEDDAFCPRKMARWDNFRFQTILRKILGV